MLRMFVHVSLIHTNHSTYLSKLNKCLDFHGLICLYVDIITHITFVYKRGISSEAVQCGDKRVPKRLFPVEYEE
jgi:hypothetical protein